MNYLTVENHWEKDKGKLRIETGKPFSDELKASFREDIPDHRILAIAEYSSKAYPNRKSILVSKDINLRMKAKSLGIQAEDYKTDQVTDENVLDKTITTFENFDDRLIDLLYEQGSFAIEEAKKGISSPMPTNVLFLKETTQVFWHGMIQRQTGFSG